MTTWIKSSKSFSNGNCVECAFHRSSHSESGNCAEAAVCAGGVTVRDSKDPDGPRLNFTASEWRGFVAAIKSR